MFFHHHRRALRKKVFRFRIPAYFIALKKTRFIVPILIARLPALWRLDGSYRKIEAFRGRLNGNQVIGAYVSPPSGRQPGPFRFSELKEHARTGALPKKGVLLKSIVLEAGAKTVLELGTNTGFSGCYFLSAGARLTTVEGSEALTRIADENMIRISGNYHIMNCLFDEAIDFLGGSRFDAIFIDGQHNRESTLHYIRKTERLLNPGGIIILDDIRWSDDMKAMWSEISKERRVVDLKYIGVILT